MNGDMTVIELFQLFSPVIQKTGRVEFTLRLPCGCRRKFLLTSPQKDIDDTNCDFRERTSREIN